MGYQIRQLTPPIKKHILSFGYHTRPPVLAGVLFDMQKRSSGYEAKINSRRQISDKQRRSSPALATEMRRT
ncbi:hypothetical protein XBP1_160008 [Xenorhabdus bovienii str. puntauvense]|uniref:Uncharacterized protein n=1 Tax=Xenorhabdus bovienii str. puntauvense TaxID=1398201 RepID=A0A077NC10_XENBV|nr:hypothetical protein XBFFR1_2090007 [Xenorhabdus bovienii str. feltiae France]CDG95798.1 hypothetical protein XBP1_160008 [Xenorhabdus bovienii str. puntauvense]